MDTPGGLGSSMREIVKSMLALEVPVVVYVAPPGSSADSAGAVIGQAADILAMAPQTNIGSSTPISASGEELGEDLRRKVINDAAAYIAELAREHGRNAEAAEAMVRTAANYGAREALELGVIDVIAPTVPALLEEIDGRKTVPKGLVLAHGGRERRARRDGLLEARARPPDRPEHHRADALDRADRDRRRALEPRPDPARARSARSR